MRFARVVTGLVLLTLFSAVSQDASSFDVRSRRLTVLGTLTGEMAIGGKSADWCIQLNPVIMVDGTQISSLEIRSTDTQKLASLEDKFVQAKGTLTFVSGGQTAQRPVFELSSIKEHKSKGARP